MKNYETKFLSTVSDEMHFSRCCIPYADLASLVTLEAADAYERALRELANQLPCKTSSWPSFGGYPDAGYRVELGPLKYQLQFRERGSLGVVANCKNIIDLSYHVFKIVLPRFTPSASNVAESLHRIHDQRLLIWLAMSSEIFHMYQINNNFGSRVLNSNVSWMCTELVRMGVYDNVADSFESEKHILQGLTLSGMPKSEAQVFYQELKKSKKNP